MAKERHTASLVYFSLALLCSAAGYAFYLHIRQFDPIFGIFYSHSLGDSGISPIFVYSFGTFIHVIALASFSYAVLGARPKVRMATVIFWVLVNVVFELLQITAGEGSSLIPGTFDPLDLLAALLGGGVFLMASRAIDNNLYSASAVPGRLTGKPGLYRTPIVALVGMASILASGEYYYDGEVPVYISYETLRGPLQIEPDRNLRETGKIYIYKQFLLVSEPNKGIHLYDNSDAAAPVHIAFLKIPGNLDIAVKDGYVYADSFVDLVVVDINDVNDLKIVHRIESAFPYDPYQALPKDKTYYFDWDESIGVVVDVKQKRLRGHY